MKSSVFQFNTLHFLGGDPYPGYSWKDKGIIEKVKSWHLGLEELEFIFKNVFEERKIK